MKHKTSEKGQALIIIAFAVVVIMGFTALAIDGARKFEDKRHAQNAADTSALAGVLAYSRTKSTTMSVIEQEMITAATTRADENGYNSANAGQIVTVQLANVTPANACPANRPGKEVTVTITSTINTTFARVIGTNSMTNIVNAKARVCGFYVGSPFDGNAIVSLARTGTAIGSDGNTNINISGGGFFSNSSSASAVDCNGAAGSLGVPSVTTAGGSITLGNCGATIPGAQSTGGTQYTGESATAFFPDQPACTGTATQSGGKWYPDASVDPTKVGSKVAFDLHHDMTFAPGIYCFTTSPGQYTHLLSGDQVMFYSALSNFSLSFQGSGAGISATAPVTGPYKGLLFYLKPQYDSNGNLLQTQSLELHGNGAAAVRGAIIAPSAAVTITGNPAGGAYQTQVIGNTVTIGGGSAVNIQYDPNLTYQEPVPYSLSLLQ